jgi:hypothetical protein
VLLCLLERDLRLLLERDLLLLLERDLLLHRLRGDLRRRHLAGGDLHGRGGDGVDGLHRLGVLLLPLGERLLGQPRRLAPLLGGADGLTGEGHVVETFEAAVQEEIPQRQRQERGGGVADAVGLHAAAHAPPGQDAVQGEEDERGRQRLLAQVEVELHQDVDEQHDVEERAETRQTEEPGGDRRQLQDFEDERREDDHRDGDRPLCLQQADHVLLEVAEQPPLLVLDHRQRRAAEDRPVVPAVLLVERRLEPHEVDREGGHHGQVGEEGAGVVEGVVAHQGVWTDAVVEPEDHLVHPDGRVVEEADADQHREVHQALEHGEIAVAARIHPARDDAQEQDERERLAGGVGGEDALRAETQEEQDHAEQGDQRAVDVRAQDLVVLAHDGEPDERDPGHADDREEGDGEEGEDGAEPGPEAETDPDRQVHRAHHQDGRDERRQDALVALGVEQVRDPARHGHLRDALQDEAEGERVGDQRPEEAVALGPAEIRAGEVEQRQGEDRHEPRPGRDEAGAGVGPHLGHETPALVDHAAQLEPDARHQSGSSWVAVSTSCTTAASGSSVTPCRWRW